MKRLLLWLIWLLSLPAAAATVVVADIHGAISPASAAYFLRALDHAQQQHASLLVLRLDTPGGLDTSMREMIQAILASPVPVATYVAPSGARAASAGTYLMYASHVAAMAPGTNLGAATPIPIAGGGGDRPSEAPASAPAAPDAMHAKVVQDAAAYLRSLAQLRGRNAEWAESAVRDARSLSVEDALRLHVIDLIAADVPDLLVKLHGRTVRVGNGTVTLALHPPAIQTVAPNWKERTLALLADPNIALLLMMAGLYGLLFEFYVPGTVAPGLIGGICLLLGLYGLALLPINVVGAALLLLGLGLMVAEAFLPSFGVIGVAGVAAFIAGALLLVDADVPGLTVSWRLVLPLGLVSALALAGIGAFALRARRRPPVTGHEAMLGATAEALEDIEREGWVRVQGERWRARSGTPLARGQHARVTAVEGLTLVVEPARKGAQQ